MPCIGSSREACARHSIATELCCAGVISCGPPDSSGGLPCASSSSIHGVAFGVLIAADLCWGDLFQVNLPAGDYYRLQQRAADSDFISQVLCVTADHNPSLGKSYPGGVICSTMPVTLPEACVM